MYRLDAAGPTLPSGRVPFGVTRPEATPESPSILRLVGFAMSAQDRRGPTNAPDWCARDARYDRVVPRILVIDNYDSFVYNLVQYIGELGGSPDVRRHDQVTAEDIEHLAPDGILVSPGPGSPDDAGISNEVIRTWAARLPVFGVCLGLQCIGQVFGGRVIRAPEIVHGKTSLIRHHGDGVFEGLPNPLEATRYHSLIVDRTTLPDELEITAETDNGIIMGLRHRTLDAEGVQFHPESILTTAGHDLIANFLRRCG